MVEISALWVRFPCRDGFLLSAVEMDDVSKAIGYHKISKIGTPKRKKNYIFKQVSWLVI